MVHWQWCSSACASVMYEWCISKLQSSPYRLIHFRHLFLAPMPQNNLNFVFSTKLFVTAKMRLRALRDIVKCISNNSNPAFWQKNPVHLNFNTNKRFFHRYEQSLKSFEKVSVVGVRRQKPIGVEYTKILHFMLVFNPIW